MPIPTGTIVSILVGVFAVVATLIAPLYVLVLKMYGRGSVAEEKRGSLGEEQSEIEETLGRIDRKLDEIEQEVQANAHRSETNQKHIHQLLLGKIEDDENDIGNPHYRSDHCPLPDECPWHSESDS